jgi:hypothetical protein
MAGKLKPHICIELTNARAKVKRSDRVTSMLCAMQRAARHGEFWRRRQARQLKSAQHLWRCIEIDRLLKLP